MFRVLVLLFASSIAMTATSLASRNPSMEPGRGEESPSQETMLVSNLSASATLSLANTAWLSKPGSAMTSVFVPGVDDIWQQAQRSFANIQNAWGGGVCAGNQVYVWGGGHTDGAHNGLFAVDVRTGKWRRVTEPSPIWTERACPLGVCKAVTGPCEFGRCNTGPDGRPVARHSYYLLASEGNALYSVGGAVWESGTGGVAPTTWTFDLSQSRWSALAESPVTSAHGSVAAAKGKLYHMTGRGFAVMDIATQKWTRPSNQPGIGGQTGLVYVPSVDRFYALGNGVAWYVDRAKWGEPGVNIGRVPSIITSKHLGITYYPPEDLILLWNGGGTITALDPKTNAWKTITPAGSPGTLKTIGTFGRLSYCGGQVVLLNGVNQDLYYLGDSEGSTTTPPPTTPPPTTPPPTPPPPTTPTLAPYYAVPPGDSLVRQQCGPESDWQIIDVTTSADANSLSQLLSSDTRAVVRVHWRPEPYPVLKVSNARCIKVVGLPGPNGERPLVGGVNGTKAFRGTIRAGGLIIQNLDVSPGKAIKLQPTLPVASADCIGVPNDQMFLIVRDSKVSRCGHHAFITAHAHHLYVEIGRSDFEQADSHLAYIDHIAMAHVYDSTFQSPGWGHALRCIALRCVIERVRVSNVQLNGTTLPVGGDNPFRPKRTYIGMQALEVYTCGQNELRDITAVFRADQVLNGDFAAIVRGREAFRTCDVGEVVQGQWTRLQWGDANFMDPKRWATVTPLTTSVERMKVTCVGPRSCIGWEVKGNYPTMDDQQKMDLQSWLKAGQYATWTDMVNAIPSDHPEWDWVVSMTLPEHRDSFRRGTITNKVPLPVPVPGWVQRTRVTLSGVTVSGGPMVNDAKEVDTYCYGLPPVTDAFGNLLNQCPQQYDGANFRRAFLTVR